MKSKIALMTILMLTLPLAGCIEGSDVAGAVQTGGDDSTDTSTGSIVNNYYYNNTTIVENTNTSDYKYLVFDTELENGAWPATVVPYSNGNEHAVVGEFNTTAGSMYSVVYDSYTCETTTGWYTMSDCRPVIKSTCGDVIYTFVVFTGASESSSSMMKGTVDSDCHHVAYASGIYVSSEDSSSVIRLHYEIGFKQIPASPY